MYEEKIRDQQQYIADLRTGIVLNCWYYFKYLMIMYSVSTHFLILKVL